MEVERWAPILAKLIGIGGTGLKTAHLCEVCAEVTEMTGAGIMLMSGDTPQGTACTTNKVSALIEQLQYALGEGPCVDAYRQERPILEPDLVEPTVLRWVAFSALAIEAGARAVFGFPIRAGAICLGAMNLYRDRPGPLSEEQHADALVMAEVAARVILILQANAPPGALADELAAGADLQYVVHQAAGMASAQLGVSVGQALIRLRAYAFGNDRPLLAVAEDVVGPDLLSW